MQNFQKFLESIKTPSNSDEINVFIEAYSALFEFPHGEAVTGEVLDFHVEDVFQKFGREKTLEYIDLMLNNLNNDKPIDVLFAEGGQLSHIEHPRDLLKPDSITDLIHRLNIAKAHFSK